MGDSTMPERVAVVMAGGQGTRFWPRSRRLRPKQFLAMTGARVTAVELDRRCIEIMGTTLKAYDNIRIVPNDVLTLDMAEVMGTAPFHIAGNLPYYITTPIIMKILEDRVPADSITVMVQKEVAERQRAETDLKEALETQKNM